MKTPFGGWLPLRHQQKKNPPNRNDGNGQGNEMFIVFKDKFGDIKWSERKEVESLESFAEKMNNRTMEMGSKLPTHWVESATTISVTEWDGKVKGTYHACSEEKPYRFL